MPHVIVNCLIHTGDEILTDHVIVVENGTVRSVQKAIPENSQLIDLQGANIAAGFIDIQLNGGERFHFSQQPTAKPSMICTRPV